MIAPLVAVVTKGPGGRETLAGGCCEAGPGLAPVPWGLAPVARPLSRRAVREGVRFSA